MVGRELCLPAACPPIAAAPQFSTLSTVDVATVRVAMMEFFATWAANGRFLAFTDGAAYFAPNAALRPEATLLIAWAVMQVANLGNTDFGQHWFLWNLPPQLLAQAPNQSFGDVLASLVRPELMQPPGAPLPQLPLPVPQVTPVAGSPMLTVETIRVMQQMAAIDADMSGAAALVSVHHTMLLIRAMLSNILELADVQGIARRVLSFLHAVAYDGTADSTALVDLRTLFNQCERRGRPMGDAACLSHLETIAPLTVSVLAARARTTASTKALDVERAMQKELKRGSAQDSTHASRRRLQRALQ